MPKQIWLTVLVIGLLCSGFAHAVQIVGAEFFYDNDPGRGNGTAIPVTAADSISVTFSPPAPSGGFHTLYVRTRDANGFWGIPTCVRMWAEALDSVPVNLARVEYFFDSDPGIGRATPAGYYNQDTLTLSFNARCSVLSTGYHTFYLRIIDQFGKAGIPTARQQWITSTPVGGGLISGAEYFFDNEPGRGQGHAITVATPGNPDTISFSVNLNGVQGGFHTLYTRVRDAYNNWSTPNAKLIWVENVSPTTPHLIGMEYFFDADPGRGNGVSVPFTQDTALQLVIPVNLTDLTSGFHTLYIRARDSVNWGFPNAHLCWVERIYATPSPIVYGEYFLDRDPGYGLGRTLTITPAETTTIAFVADLSQLAGGYHNLYIRVRDSVGRWSVPNEARVYVQAPPLQPPVLLMQYQSNRAMLSWTAATDSSVTNFKIYRNETGYFTPPTQGTLIGTVNRQTTAFTDTTAVARYYYRVTAINYGTP